MMPAMLKRITAAAIVGLCSAVTFAQSGPVPYKVLTARLFEIQEVLNNAAKEGWQLRSMSPSMECNYPIPGNSNGRTAKGECMVLVMERART